ncbi:ABC transporter ATP-binding protein [Mycoplasma sp. 744]|uniref:ABC transporter ATP-binding protein n=1 Tax=Mycoplasma sp. 744 TaxID=3108531 RepID=UPI002B1E3835|nr:ABC transporter ATP-binding protein [Mycoplasma sp. 744]MEA4115656.1 ABC transporter ATP-binding protein [Mycoplasma sp. 744]
MRNIVKINKKIKTLKKVIKAIPPIIPNENIALSIQNLTKIFKNKNKENQIALNKVTFEVKKGQFHGFIGDNGAGKTTTIRSILGFYKSILGHIYINQLKNSEISSRNLIGYIPEIAIFPKNLTALEYLIEMGKLNKINKKEVINKIDDLLLKIKMNKEQLNKSAYFMSSGQKKKILLIQALLNDPQILILDEPASNLDPSTRLDFFQILKTLNNEGKTILISSHIISELEQYIDSYTVLKNGEVIESISVKDKLKQLEYNKEIKTSNNKLLQIFLIENRIKNKIDEKENKIYLTINTEKEKILLKYLINQKIQIIFYKDTSIELNKMYFNL